MEELTIMHFQVLEELATAPTIPYGVKMIGAELEWPETKGAGVKVAVLDTGRPKHPDLKVAGAVDFTNSGINDHHGHSTHVCGIIAANGRIKGVAPECELFTAKVIDNRNIGCYDWVADSVLWCIDNNIDVINLSIGGGKPPATTLHNALKQALDAGIVIVAAAGNSGERGIVYPAAYPECIATVAVDIDKKRPEFSSRGVEADLAAAGVEVHSTHLNGKYARLSGTSMACPHITGAAALKIAKCRKRKLPVTPEFIRYTMKYYAEDLGILGHDWDFGYGVFSFGRVLSGVPDRSPIDLRFEVGQKHYWKNGVRHDSLTAPVVIENRSFLGLRDVGNALDAEVTWNRPFITIRRT